VVPHPATGTNARCHASVVPSVRVLVIAFGVVGQPAAKRSTHTEAMSSVRTAQLASRGAGSAASAAPNPVGSGR